jgi:hypothetical protein
VFGVGSFSGENTMGFVFAARVISAVFVAALAVGSAAARNFKVGALDIGRLWSLPTANGVTVAGV